MTGGAGVRLYLASALNPIQQGLKPQGIDFNRSPILGPQRLIQYNKD